MIAEPWIKNKLLELNRIICHSICFDGIVKIYKIDSPESKVQLLLSSRLYLDFYILTDKGIFLREIESPLVWPITKLVYLNLESNVIVDIYESNSSYQVWKTKHYNNFKLKIAMQRPVDGEEHGIIINKYEPYELVEF